MASIIGAVRIQLTELEREALVLARNAELAQDKLDNLRRIQMRIVSLREQLAMIGG